MDVRSLARTRWRVALGLTATMIVIYFGFMLLIAFDKPLMGRLLTPGLSLGVVLGALVIVAAWLLTFAYLRWTTRVYDPALDRLRQSQPGSGR